MAVNAARAAAASMHRGEGVGVACVGEADCEMTDFLPRRMDHISASSHIQWGASPITFPLPLGFGQAVTNFCKM